MNHKKIMIPIVLLGNLISITILMFTLYIFITKPASLETIFPDAGNAPLAFLIIGITLLIASNRPWRRLIQKDTMPSEKRIERYDERNIQIEQKSDQLAFQFLSLAILYAICILSILGYLNNTLNLIFVGIVTISLLIKYLSKRYFSNRL